MSHNDESHCPVWLTFSGRGLMVAFVAVVVSLITWYLEVAYWPQQSTTWALQQFSDGHVGELHRQTELHGIMPAAGAMLVVSVWAFLFLPGYQQRLQSAIDAFLDWSE